MSAGADISCFGECVDCGRRHHLGDGNAREHARAMIREFEAIRRLDYRVDEVAADPELSFESLFPGERGNMFGVLECLGAGGETVVLRAFSSLEGGIRSIEGWVPPLLSAETYSNLILPGQWEIKRLTLEMRSQDSESPAFAALAGERKEISQILMGRMHDLYRFSNFRGDSRGLREIYHVPNRKKGRDGIPGGVGECCAPKLLNWAVQNELRPVGIAEFYWGGTGDSGSKRPGTLYPCCESRCQPILGFMLCGLDE